MKKVLSALTIGVILIGGIVEASTSPSTPVAIRLVGPLGTWTGSASNPIYVTFSSSATDTIEIVSEVTLLKAGTLTGIVNTVTVSSAQLPATLDSNGGLKTTQQGTLNTKIVDADGHAANVTPGGALDVNIVSQVAGGTIKTGRYTASVGAGATVELGSYTVTTGKTLYLEGFIGTAKGDADWQIKVNGVAVSDFTTNPIISSFDRYLGGNFTVSSSAVITVFATNNEATAVTATLSWHGTEK